MINNFENFEWLVKNYQQYLMQCYPSFALHVNKEKQESEDMGYEYTIWSFFNDLTYYTKELIRCKKNEELKKIFSVVEVLLIHGSEDLYNAATTCFIENLINTASHSDEKNITYNTFVPFLGDKAKEYCRYWDKLMGGPKTPGVYKDR